MQVSKYFKSGNSLEFIIEHFGVALLNSNDEKLAVYDNKHLIGRKFALNFRLHLRLRKQHVSKNLLLILDLES